MIDVEKIEGFDWDAGNARKNEKHGVTRPKLSQKRFIRAEVALLTKPCASAHPGTPLCLVRIMY